jgi:hypothetical protein
LTPKNAKRLLVITKKEAVAPLLKRERKLQGVPPPAT